MDRFSTNRLLIFFILFILYSSSSVFALSEADFGCNSILKSNSGGLFNASYNNCVNPVGLNVTTILNITNVTNVTQVVVVNTTNLTVLNFNQSDLAKNIFDWENTFKSNIELNTSVAGLGLLARNLQLENDALNIKVLNGNTVNASYTSLQTLYNLTKTERDAFKGDSDSRLIIALVVGGIGYFLGNERKNVVPLRRLEIKRTTGKSLADAPSELLDVSLKGDVEDDSLEDSKIDKEDK